MNLCEDTAEKVIPLLATFMILFNRNFGCKIFPEFLTALHHTILKRCEINEKKKKNELFIFLRIITRPSRSSLEQALHLGESREVTREQHAKGDASTFGRHT